MHILDREAPGLAEKIGALSAEASKTVLVNACLLVSEGLAVLEPSVRGLLDSLKKNGSLLPDEVAVARTLAEAADSNYLTLQRQSTREVQAISAFSTARLLTAMSIGFSGTTTESVADAVYELCNTYDDPSPLIRSVRSDIERATRHL